MIGTVCRGCKQLAEIVHTDELGLEYCASCAADLPKPPEIAGLEFLLATIPYVKGDRVECRTAGVMYDGIGTVQEISFEIERGGGTLVHPAFLVAIDEPANENSPAEAYYTEACLTRVKENDHDDT
jgi:hypothetical protein